MSAKNQISYDEYLKIKDRSTQKPYALRFRPLRLGGLIFSIFGNLASIFFAYFFFLNLFSGAFINLTGIGVSIGIVVFLTLFEWVKRYVFNIFSHQHVQTKNSIFRKNMISFLFLTLVLAGFSFFFSLNGAQDFMNQEKVIVAATDSIINVQVDSIKIQYLAENIQPLKEENAKYLEQKDELQEQQNEYVRRGWDIAQFVEQIADINEKINYNKEQIFKYETERNQEILAFKTTQLNKLNKKQEENKSNIINFLLLSFMIELVIMFGVYYNRVYEHKVEVEYERTIANKPQFKKWRKYDDLLEIMLQGINTGEVLPTNNALEELVSINELNISKKDVEDCLKVLHHLKIYQREGNKRILLYSKEDAKQLLREHFKIK
jgi:nitrate reductase NapE component